MHGITYEFGEIGKMDLEIYKTEDGSHSLFNPALDEIYHSKHGAVNESNHVFIKAGLEYIADRFKTIKILEVGFGTGLNAMLTLEYCFFNKIEAQYFTLEPFPIKSDIFEKLNHHEFCKIPKSELLFKKMHHSLWNKKIHLNDKFLFFKSTNGIWDEQFAPECFNLIYFDAFAMDIQPEMWSQEVFERIFQSLEQNGVLVTYAAKGQIRRNLQGAGFSVERIPGPKGKREMLRATKN